MQHRHLPFFKKESKSKEKIENIGKGIKAQVNTAQGLSYRSTSEQAIYIIQLNEAVQNHQNEMKLQKQASAVQQQELALLKAHISVSEA